MARLFLIDSNDRVVGMNPAARQLIAEHPKLVSSDHRLALGGGEAYPDGPVQGLDEDGGMSWKVWVTPLEDGPPDTAYRVIVLYPKAPMAELDLSSLERQFRLTKAELRLVKQVLAGQRPAEAARAMGVTVFTVRTYLKRLFHKLGVNNQAGLVRVLLEVLHESQFA